MIVNDGQCQKLNKPVYYYHSLNMIDSNEFLKTISTNSICIICSKDCHPEIFLRFPKNGHVYHFSVY